MYRAPLSNVITAASGLISIANWISRVVLFEPLPSKRGILRAPIENRNSLRRLRLSRWAWFCKFGGPTTSGSAKTQNHRSRVAGHALTDQRAIGPSSANVFDSICDVIRYCLVQLSPTKSQKLLSGLAARNSLSRSFPLSFSSSSYTVLPFFLKTKIKDSFTTWRLCIWWSVNILVIKIKNWKHESHFLC